MRGVTSDEDRGIATLIVVLLMPVLILFGALVFDGGRGYLARRQTQSAADAGALAKATDCALQRSATVFTAYQTNGATLSNTPTCDAGTTTVSMSRAVSFVFATGGGTVTRSATAKWGTVGMATTLPITISNCEFTQALLDGTADIVIYLDDAKPQSGCSSLPGGFSQLKNSKCAVTITAGNLIPGDPGGDVMKQIPCITNPDPNATPLPYKVLIPMYDAGACKIAGCNGQGPYKILGFAVFNVTSYSFNGNNYYGSLGRNCPDQQRGKYCIKGDFERYVYTQGTPGPSTDFGTYGVYLAS